MVNCLKNRKGTTLIELIVLILIVAIIGATIGGVAIFFVQLFMYSPRQLDTQKIAQELTHTMIEGTPDIRGIRYTRTIIDASSTQFSYTYGYPTSDDQWSVRFRWDNADGHIYRSTSTDSGVTWSTEEVIPYYILSNTTIDGKDTSGVIFTYKKASDADWISGTDVVDEIQRLSIDINIKTGAGNFNAFEGSSDVTSGVEIKSFL